MYPVSRNFSRVAPSKVSILLFFCSRKAKRLIILCVKNGLFSFKTSYFTSHIKKNQKIFPIVPVT